MEKTYDPLRLVIAQNTEERGAYALGVEKGEKIGDEKAQEVLWKLRNWLCSRILAVKQIGERPNIGNQKSVFLKGKKPYEAYVAGLEDALKVLVNELHDETPQEIK